MEKVEGRMWKREEEWRRLKKKVEEGRGMEKVEGRKRKREEEWRRLKGEG